MSESGSDPLHSATAPLASPKVAESIAWQRDVSPHDFVNRWSVQHVAEDNANHTLCGARIRWNYVGPGDSRRCPRCWAVAAKRDYVTFGGDPLMEYVND